MDGVSESLRDCSGRGWGGFSHRPCVGQQRKQYRGAPSSTNGFRVSTQATNSRNRGTKRVRGVLRRADQQEKEMSEQEMNERLREMLDRQEIHDCIVHYCLGVDRLDAEMLASAYHPDAIDDQGIYVGRLRRFADYFLADRNFLSPLSPG